MSCTLEASRRKICARGAKSYEYEGPYLATALMELAQERKVTRARTAGYPDREYMFR
jgi:hypothetical protein